MARRLIVVLFLLVASSAEAQDVVARARALAVAGDRAAALRILEERLAADPRDNDARTLYGIVLSWEGRYDDARRVLREVIAAEPNNHDARDALARVEAWSRARGGRREAAAGINYDDYDDLSDWIEPHASVELPTRAGAFVARLSHGRRFGLDDMMGEVELYPRFGRRSYAFLSAAASADGELYPDTRFGAEAYHTFASGVEVSAGGRHLAFDDAVTIYTASAGLYRGNWYLTARGYFTDDANSGALLIRRYVSDDNHYFGFRIGFGRDEIRSESDLESLDRTEVAAEARLPLARDWSLMLRLGGGEGKGTGTVGVGRRF